MAYVPNLADEALARVRTRTRLTLVCGQGKWEDGNVDETRVFGKILEAKEKAEPAPAKSQYVTESILQ